MAGNCEIRKPELLSPAGSPEALRAAVQNGADAVYLGWGEYQARNRAKGFTEQEFREALAYCRVRGVRVFLTLNTLLSDTELPKALAQARTASRLGVDAVLVQDWGLFTLLRRTLPDLPVHASTQMSVFTGGGADLLWRDGCERIVLARECSREDYLAIREKCGAELELFSHGALCMCYSGQCAMSAVVGGRSGNRGRCAQPCRMCYSVGRLEQDAGGLKQESAGSLEKGGTGKRKSGPAAGAFPLSLKDPGAFPLSLKDLCMASHVPELISLGVDCLKLEGRLKRAEYVAVVTSIYARLLRENRVPTAEEAAELELAFSRSGFTDGYWTGRTGPAMFGVRGQEETAAQRELFARARASYEKDDRRTAPVRFALSVTAGQPCVLTASDRDGHTVRVEGPAPEAARTRALTEEEAAARLGKTGGTPYRCEGTAAEIGEGLSLAASVLNGLRREPFR